MGQRKDDFGNGWSDKVAFEVGDDVKGPNPNGASFVTSGDVEVGLVLAKA